MGEGLSHKQVYPQEDYCSRTESCQQAFKCVPGMYSLFFLKETIAGFYSDVFCSLEQRGRCPPILFVAHCTKKKISLPGLNL